MGDVSEQLRMPPGTGKQCLTGLRWTQPATGMICELGTTFGGQVGHCVRLYIKAFLDRRSDAPQRPDLGAARSMLDRCCQPGCWLRGKTTGSAVPTHICDALETTTSKPSLPVHPRLRGSPMGALHSPRLPILRQHACAAPRGVPRLVQAVAYRSVRPWVQPADIHRPQMQRNLSPTREMVR